jgi:hypothetical protein
MESEPRYLANHVKRPAIKIGEPFRKASRGVQGTIRMGEPQVMENKIK